MKTIEGEAFPANEWKRRSRLRQPYAFHPISLIDGEEPTGSPIRVAANTIEEWRTSVRFLKGPIHPHLFKLIPGDWDTISRFATEFGLDELIQWGIRHDDQYLSEPWVQLWTDLSFVDGGASTVPKVHLLEAWGLGSQAEAFREAQTQLREAYKYAEQNTEDATLEFLHHYSKLIHNDPGIESWSFPSSVETRVTPWPVDPIDPKNARTNPVLGLVEKPADIFSRAWLELFDKLQEGRVPKSCPRCADPFIGERTSQKYCSRRCQDNRRRTERQRLLEKMYQRKRRGTMSSDDFENWKKREGYN